MTLWLGKREVQIIHIGRGHTRGDTVVWLPKEKVLFAGDLVEFGATPYCGDAHFTDWPATLDGVAALGAGAAGARPRPQPDRRRTEVGRGHRRHRRVHLAICSRIAKAGVGQGRDAEAGLRRGDGARCGRNTGIG